MADLTERPVIGVTVGDPAGIGPEVVIKALSEPALYKEAQRRGWRVQGPVPADSVFHLALEGRYDGVLSLYHDQGHIASKTLDFHGTVSLTMGLKFLRTSVDHGTAFDIAGQGIAAERGMVEAIRAAGQYAVPVRERLEMSL